MKLIVISSSKNTASEIKTVIQMFENGLEHFHLRKPKLSSKKLSEYISAIPAHFHNRIIIHSHHQLALKFNLMGIHYTRSHLRPTFKNWWRAKRIAFSGKKLLKTSSFTKLSDLYDEPEIMYDYVFLSPIFDSLTGKYQSGFYEEGIYAALSKTKYKVVARGGVDITRVEKGKEFGFYGLGFYSSIWESQEPLKEFINIVKRYKELEIPVI